MIGLFDYVVGDPADTEARRQNLPILNDYKLLPTSLSKEEDHLRISRSYLYVSFALSAIKQQYAAMRDYLQQNSGRLDLRRRGTQLANCAAYRSRLLVELHTKVRLCSVTAALPTRRSSRHGLRGFLVVCQRRRHEPTLYF